MPDKFKNKYRVPSTRLYNWDYGWNGAYFITICTKNRKHFLGNIIETANLDVSMMHLSTIGKILNEYWHEIPVHFPFVKLDAFVVMPNHIHGILIIDKTNDDSNNDAVETPKLGVSTRDIILRSNNINTPHSNCDKITGLTDINTKQNVAASKKWNPASLGVIINQYKRICTINAHEINTDFEWQSRFYDHIIRNDTEFCKIKDYIINNPKNWNGDKLDSNNQFNSNSDKKL